ncbi:T9SS type A sorting domain-containing protein [Flavobacterium sp. 7A]|uniref:T9SS type A sorting domain-containing protein n=1 Tax=Flavobacterium sp. 7A TaxID=2940571 RepID=UPI002226300E|nr:T9SS type A sorting domain-containing protein [Flavobacterium sp. 7A]MCW2119511.1 hypothetical protein [Flavobacterium sp. 7A]
MKLSLHVKTFIIICCLFLSTRIEAQNNFYQGTLDQTSWDNLITQISTKRAFLSNQITQLQTANLEARYAQGTIVTADEFVVYASRDRDNAGVLQTKYTGSGYTGFNNQFTAQLTRQGMTASTFSSFDPFQILNDCVKILDNAIAEATKQLDGSIMLPAVQDFSSSGDPTLSNTSSYYKKGGRTIFPSTMWSMQSDPNLMQTLGYLSSSFLSPQTTNAPNATFAPNQLSSQTNMVSTNVSKGQSPVQVQITHNPLAGWMTTASNDSSSPFYKIADYRRAFAAYDIDYPIIADNTDPNNWNKNMLQSYIPGIKSAAGSSPLIYVLSNEPHWDLISTSKNDDASKGLSPYTRTAFVEYLKVAYNNNIATLNTVYNPFNSNANYSSFDDLKNLPAQTSSTSPLALFTDIQQATLQGTPIWYDWLRFNQNRATKWHLNLKKYTLESDPTAKVSIKIIGNEVESPDRDSGIDLEASGDLMDIISFDSQITPSTTHGRNARFYRDWWLGRYITEWREQSINIDFFKSLYPNKPIFDSEWHGISSNAWYNFALDKGFVHSGLWHGFTNGLGVVNAWWWYREDGTNGTIKGDLEGKTNTVGNTMSSPQHQPIAFEDFGRTMKEVNALSETVASLSPLKRDFLIYYSNEAALQDFTYIQQMGQIYEALKLMNVKVGFTTENKIQNLGYTPKAIIIPPTLFIKNTSIDALNTYKSNNSSVAILEIKRSGTTNFVNDEKGTPNTSRNIGFTTANFTYNGAFSYLPTNATPNSAQIATNSANANTILTTLITNLRSTLTIPTPTIDFKIQEVGSSTEAFGVLASQGNTPDGKAVVSLINLSLTDKQIKLPTSSVAYSNMIDGTTLGETFIMKPYDVLLVKTGITLATKIFSDNVFKPYKIYPNPAKDVITIENTIGGYYSIYNTLGQKVKERTTENLSITIPLNDLNTGVYFISIPNTENKNVFEKIIISK